MGKTLGTRQKLSFRIEPSQRNLQARGPRVHAPPQPNKNGMPHANPKQTKKAETAPVQAQEAKTT